MNIGGIFLEHLDRITGRSEDVIRQVDSSDPSLPPMAIFIYRNWPEEGFITSFTFGLSATTHPDWKLGRPELMIFPLSPPMKIPGQLRWVTWQSRCEANAHSAMATPSTSALRSAKRVGDGRLPHDVARAISEEGPKCR